MADVNVPLGGLLTALNVAKAGDRLLLAPGEHVGVKVAAINPAIMLTSADPDNRAVLLESRFSDIDGLQVEGINLHVKATPVNYWGFHFTRCDNLRLSNVRVYGSKDAIPDNDGNGVSVQKSDGVKILDSEFSDLGRALAVGLSRNILVNGNDVHGLRSDGFDFAAVVNCEVSGNKIGEIRWSGNDHPDAIQFWTSGTTYPSTDILIARNIIYRGEGMGFQAIFLRDQLGNLPYERLVIEDNIILGTGWNGIRVNGAKGIVCRNNRLVTFDKVGDIPANELVTYILLQKCFGGECVGNSADRISYLETLDVVQRDNVITTPVTDLGSAALAEWLEAHATSDEKDDVAELQRLLEVALADLREATTKIGEATDTIAMQSATIDAQARQLNDYRAALDTANAKIAAGLAALQ